MTIIFTIILMAFFAALFVPAGVVFNSYAISQVNLNQSSVLENSGYDGFIGLEADGNKYFIDERSFQRAEENGAESILAFDDSPAFKAQIPQGSSIIEINGEKTDSREKLSEIMSRHNNGDEINLKVAVLQPGQGTVKEVKEYKVVLDEREGRAFLGVGFFPPNTEGLTGFVYSNTVAKVKEPNIQYNSKIGDFGWFVYYLLWWIVMINIAVALFNMLPLGILDGGRFFYLTILGITKSEKAGKAAYKVATWLIILVLAAMMIKWAFAFF